MNLWDVIIAIGSGLLKQADKQQKNIQKYEEKYKDLDHNELVRKYRGSTGDAKLATGLLLKKEMQKNNKH